MKLTPHRADAVSFAFGLAFLIAAALWLVANFVALSPATVGWFVAGGLLGLGVLGLARTLRYRSGDRPD